MIQPGTYLKVIDNTYLKEISCIQVKKGGRRPVGQQGDIFVASVKSLRKLKASIKRSQKHLESRTKRRTFKRGDLVTALVVRTKKSLDRSRSLGSKAKNQSGIRIGFPMENAAIIMTKNGKDIQGSRMKGPVSPTTRSKGFSKVYSLGARPI